jgi:hypothetical protein
MTNRESQMCKLLKKAEIEMLSFTIRVMKKKTEIVLKGVIV